MTPDLDPMHRRTAVDTIVVLVFFICAIISGASSIHNRSQINDLRRELHKKDSIICELNADVITLMVQHEDDSLLDIYLSQP